MDYLTFFRQFRLGSITIFDTLLAYVGTYFLAPFLSKVFQKLHLSIPRSSWLWLTLPLAILFHLLFRQSTPLMKLLSHPLQAWPLVALLVLMIFLGLRQIKYRS